MYVDLKDRRLEYCGRIDWEGNLSVFIYPSTLLEFHFFGRRAVLSVEKRRLYWDNYAGAIVDGVQKKYLLRPEGVTELVLVDDAPGQEREHEILFFKRQDACHEMKLRGLELSEDDGLAEIPGGQELRIEVYGDSVSAGEVSEAEGLCRKARPGASGRIFQQLVFICVDNSEETWRENPQYFPGRDSPSVRQRLCGAGLSGDGGYLG